MSIKAALLFFLLPWQVLLAQDSGKGDPFYETFSINDYAAGPTNRSITQNEEGVLFFANNFGVIKYDGVEWELILVEVREGLSATAVFHHQDRLYIGSQREFGYYEKDKIGQLIYHSLTPLLTDANRSDFREVWKIWNIGEKVIFYTHDLLFVYHKDQLTSFSLQDYQPGAARWEDLLYFTNTTGTLLTFDGTAFKPVMTDPLLTDAVIKNIIPRDEKDALIVTDREVLHIQNNRITSWLPGNSPSLSNAKIVTAVRGQDDQLIIGTKDRGLLMISGDGQLMNVIDNTNGLKSTLVHDIFRDRYNSLWVAHNNGISRLDIDLPFETYGETLGVLGAGYSAVIHNVALFLGTENGLFVKEKDASSFQLIPGSDGATHSLFHHNGRLLAAHQKGLFELTDQKQVRWLSESDGMWTFKINPKFPDWLYIGSYHGLYIMNTVTNQVTKVRGFEEACIVMEFDDQGYLWVTHGLVGIFKIELARGGDTIKKVDFFGKNDIPGSHYHTNVFKINDEVIFTGNTGIFRFNHDQQNFQRYHQYDEVLDQSFHIREFEEDEAGNLYFWSQEEAGILRKQENGQYEKNAQPFNKIISKVDNGIVEFIAVDKENIFFGANEGFIKYNPEEVIAPPDTFKTLIRAVEIFSQTDSTIFINNDHHSLKESPVIPYDQNALRFKYSAVFYADHESTLYQYLIEGFEEGWSQWSTASEKEFINLPEGRYTFHVKAKNIYGTISETSSFAFTILPPWYRSRLAYLTYFLLITGILYLAFRWLQRKHHREKKEIEAISEQEISKRDTTIKSIAKQSEEQIMQLKNEKLTSEINHKNKELASSTLHLINKNKLLAEIKSRLQTTIKDHEKVAVEQDVKGIIKDIDKNIENDSDWEQFEFHFDMVHGDFSSRIRQAYPNLSPQDMKIAAYLRMNLSTKEIAQLSNISLRGVEKARYRLRKKLELERQINLTEFLLNF